MTGRRRHRGLLADQHLPCVVVVAGEDPDAGVHAHGRALAHIGRLLNHLEVREVAVDAGNFLQRTISGSVVDHYNFGRVVTPGVDDGREPFVTGGQSIGLIEGR